MKNYEIIYKTNNYYLVAIKSVYSVGRIIKEFVEENINNSNFSGDIDFDLLLSSNSYESEDRFWQFHASDGNVDFRNKKIYRPDKKYIKASDDFFSKNSDLFKASLVLPFNNKC